jgi:histidine ammonia-lyase
MSIGASSQVRRAVALDALAVGGADLSLEDVLALARGERLVRLDDAPEVRDKIERARAVVEKLESEGGAVYGVTTGVGASAHVSIPEALRDAMPHNLMRFHGCGTGRILDEVETAAVVTVRLATLARGHSGVRVELLERMCELLNARLLPRIPEEGSVGASGDLTPLSYLAAAIAGEREVSYRGREWPAADALAEAGIRPLSLLPKESLSLMNGTGVMTAIACLCVARARRVARLSASITAIAVDVTRGNPTHFDERIFDWKPHPGQRRCAAWIRDDLDFPDPVLHPPERLQDRYSLRCAPHVIGVLVDSAESAQSVLEVEINGIDDNPIVDPDRGEVLHGGNFYGGHVCQAMDGLKAAVASVADLLDRQLSLLCVPETSGGLPANLVAVDDVSHHGFKAMQISASALAAEALKLTMPASAFSRSTESHNQDKVSMGTIAARDCRRVLELCETVAAIGTLAVSQALDLRDGASRRRAALSLHAAVRGVAPKLDADRRQDLDIARVLELMRTDALPLGPYGSSESP